MKTRAIACESQRKKRPCVFKNGHELKIQVQGFLMFNFRKSTRSNAQN